MIKILGIGLAAFLLFVLQENIYRHMWNKNLKISIKFSQFGIFEGEKGELLEVIENQKRLPLSMLKVKFQTDRNLVFSDSEGTKVTDQYYRNDVFRIGGGERIIRTLEFTGNKRGYYKINGIDVVGSDLFLSNILTEHRNASSYIYVYPKPYNSREFYLSLQQLNGEVLTRRHLLEDPFEYRGIREYQPFDDMRNVNWKATAKTEDLKVNQKNYTSLQSIRIFFNLEEGILKEEDSMEAGLSIVAGLANFFLSQGIRVSCYGNGYDILTGDLTNIAASAGRGQMEKIYKSLARIDIRQKAAPFDENFGQKLIHEAKGTMTFLVSPSSYENFTNLMMEYLATGEDFVWFYPTWEKKELILPKELISHIKLIHLDSREVL